MVPSGLLPGARQTLLISLLLVCCLLPPGARGQQFPLRVEPQDPVVPAGGSLLVNCTTNCPHAELLTLETSLIKKLVGNGMGWTAFQLSSVTGDSQVLCSGYCNGSQVIGSSSITVYGVPERVELAPLPDWQPVGENFTLRCQVEGGAPRTNLTVVLLRGEEELSRQPAVGEPAEVTATVRAGRDHHGANFSCRTELDLRPRGLELFVSSSAPRQLRTFALTMPYLVVSPLLEVETSWSVDCILYGLFPASEAKVQVALGDQMLNATVESHGDKLMATATATASAEQEGTQQMVCNVTLGGDSLETRKNVTIYSFLGPILNLSEPTAREGTTVTVTCAAGAQVQVTLDGISSAGPGQLAQLQLNATEEDDRRSFFCIATLRVDGEIFHRNRSVQLRVLYGPKIDRTKCPQSVTWQEKTTHVLQCQARGNPDPQLQCLKEGSAVKVPVGTPFFVRLKHNGTYSCRANSSLGEYSLTVVMNVQDRNPIAVGIGMGALVILGLVIIAAALVYVFGMKKRRDSYHVKNQGSTWLPLTSKQPNEDVGEEPS